tara:strand:+ start:62 stop:595 length:534 start_codon:yes stop_codon:yes gene_type:complete
MTIDKTTLGGGCFWCLEAIFTQINGVIKVASGYAGGNKSNPTYQEVCSEITGHAEVVQITFNPQLISFLTILEVFFAIHDPTTLNQQGNDIGTQYRSIILYQNEKQKIESSKFIKMLSKNKVFTQPIVTELEPLIIFYEAEEYHQNYFENNPNQGYCSYVIAPKLLKFKEKYNSILK